MKTIRDYMKNEKTIFIIIAAVAVFITLSANIYNSIKSYQYRRLCSEYREQLIAATEANREFADRIGRIAEIVGRIKEAADANITNAKGIIETVEQIRTQIQELENICGSFNQSEYYSYWDSCYRDEGLMD